METEITNITNISNHGFWILSNTKEFFLPYEHFPWFKDKTIKEITEIETFGESHLYWPKLDVDLSIDIIEHPERFPLIAIQTESCNDKKRIKKRSRI